MTFPSPHHHLFSCWWAQLRPAPGCCHVLRPHWRPSQPGKKRGLWFGSPPSPPQSACCLRRQVRLSYVNIANPNKSRLVISRVQQWVSRIFLAKYVNVLTKDSKMIFQLNVSFFRWQCPTSAPLHRSLLPSEQPNPLHSSQHRICHTEIFLQYPPNPAADWKQMETTPHHLRSEQPRTACQPNFHLEQDKRHPHRKQDMAPKQFQNLYEDNQLCNSECTSVTQTIKANHQASQKTWIIHWHL